MDKKRKKEAEKELIDTLERATEYINTGDADIIMGISSEKKRKAVLSAVVDLQESIKHCRETKDIEEG